MIATIEKPITGFDVLTHSCLACAKSCLRKYHYHYQLGIIRARDAQALRMGSAYHLGMELLANGNDIDAVADAIRTNYADIPEYVLTTGEEAVFGWQIECEKVVTLVSMWHQLYAGQHLEVIAAEIPFELPITNPETGRISQTYRKAGKIDQIVRLPDGRIAIREFKTTGDDISIASDYWQRLRIDHQISHYMIAARELGHDVQTVIYDVARKPTISPRLIPELDAGGLKVVKDANGNRIIGKNGKPRQTGDDDLGWKLVQRRESVVEYAERLRADILERPQFYFARNEIPRLENDLDEYRHELWQMANHLRETKNAGRWFRNTSACLIFGRCEYFDICTNNIDLTQGVPSGYVQVDSVHQEL